MSKKYKLYNGRLYNYGNFFTCGVLIRERIMRKISKLQSKYLEEVKKVLTSGAENNEVFSSNWTLHYPEGEQTTVRFIDISLDVKNSIDSATLTAKPLYSPVVFIAASMKEAEEMANERAKEKINEY